MHLQDRLKLVDMVLEVRDARIPFSSANPELEALVRHKRRLIVLNKADLAAPDKQQVGGTNVLHVNKHMHTQVLLTTLLGSALAYVVLHLLKGSCTQSAAFAAGCFAPLTGAAVVCPVHEQSEAWQHPTSAAKHHAKAEGRQTQRRHAHDHGCG